MSETLFPDLDTDTERFDLSEPEETLGRAKELLLKDSEHKDIADEELLEDVTDLFTSWLDEDTYLLMEEREEFDDYTKDDKTDRYGVKASKRGNSVYRERTLERFEEIRGVLPDAQFFNPKEKHDVKRTPAFFVTLTYDTDHKDLVRAWDDVGEDYNRFRSRLQREFATRCERVGERGHRIEDCETCEDARIRQVRVFEGREDGYPAPHALIVFDEDFPVHYHSRSESWRMSYATKERIGDAWDAGFVDVKAVHSLGGNLSSEDAEPLEVIENPDGASAVASDGGDRRGGAVDYMLKYLRKTLSSAQGETDETHLRTLAMSWLTEKRMFSASSEWDEVMTDTYLPDSNPLCTIQTDVDGNEVSKVEIDMLGSFVVHTDGDNPPPWRLDLDGSLEEDAIQLATES